MRSRLRVVVDWIGARLLPTGWRDFFIQAVIFWTFYFAYEGSRGVVDGARSVAFANARDLISLERATGLYHELDLQHWVLTSAPHLLLELANWTYFNCQFTISYGFMLWLFFRRNYAFYFARDVLIIAGLIGLIGYVTLPMAPPRMFPELGFVDTLNQTAINHQSGLIARFSNPYAAMPSLHTAYAFTVGTTGFLVSRRWWGKAIWAVYPALVVFSIVTTANHYLLDAIAGASVAALALCLTLSMTRGVTPRRGRPPAGPLVPRLDRPRDAAPETAELAAA